MLKKGIKEYFWINNQSIQDVQKEYRRFKEQIVEKSNRIMKIIKLNLKLIVNLWEVAGCVLREDTKISWLHQEKGNSWTFKNRLAKRTNANWMNCLQAMKVLNSLPQEERELQTYISYLKRARKDKLREVVTILTIFIPRSSKFLLQARSWSTSDAIRKCRNPKLYDLYDEFLRYNWKWRSTSRPSRGIWQLSLLTLKKFQKKKWLN